MEFRIGTRGSKLALWQAEKVGQILDKNSLSHQLHIVKTTGDLIQDRPLHAVGGVGLFTKALDDALLNGEVDLAVHSAKDLPATLTEGIVLAGVLKREDPRDVLLSTDKDIQFDNLNRKWKVGTSALRRQALVRHFFPQVEIQDLRGNVDTRVQKMQSGEYDGILLAFAGVKRMGYESMVVQKLNPESFTPAVGQGIIAVTTREDFSELNKLREAINHRPTELALNAERAFLRRIEGGCHTPSFGLATVTGRHLSLNAGVATLDGQHLIRESGTTDAGSGDQLGEQIAMAVLKAQSHAGVTI